MKNYKLLSLFLFGGLAASAQVTTLSADGPGDTYELINSVLAPGYDVVEVPDCVHTSFGRHIEEVWDSELNKYVFKFHIHVEPDNDRCIKFDRQRNEIKTYNQSPANLIGTYGETVRYKWKFKLDSGFQPSNKFTHIHQIKAYGGPYESIPVVSIIPRGGSSPKLQLMHSDSITSVQVDYAPLSDFKGVWVEATEVITYKTDGYYSLELKRISDGATLMSYSNSNINMWRQNANGIRPKWGIYRSLLSADQLRDEEVLFADFSIEEITSPMALDSGKVENNEVFIPNPVGDTLELPQDKWKRLTIIDMQGKVVLDKKNIKSRRVDVSGLQSGNYIVKLFDDKKETSLRIVKK